LRQRTIHSCEDDAYGVRRARVQIVDEQAIVGINVGRSDSGVPNQSPNAPAERVILPDD